jgi:hypothetical protein
MHAHRERTVGLFTGGALNDSVVQSRRIATY